MLDWSQGKGRGGVGVSENDILEELDGMWGQERVLLLR